MFPSDSNLESKFTFETDVTPLSEEPPFHILMLGNWSGNLQRQEIAQRQPKLIDRDNFDDVMRRLNVGLEIDLHGDGKSLLQFQFAELDDFHPDSLFRQISVFSDLRDIRRRLSNSETFDIAANEVRSWIKTSENVTRTKTKAETNQNQPVHEDNLLDMILTGSDSTSVSNQQAYDSELGRFVSDIVSPFLVKIDENEQSKLTAVVDEAISELMRAILHHPAFQELESAWRGLYFLVRRVETDVDLKIFIWDISEDELSDNLKSVNNLTDSLLYRQGVSETLEIPGGVPFSVIGGNYSFGVNVDDVATLIRISKIAHAASAPFISYIQPEMFKLRSFTERFDLSEVKFQEESSAGKLWTALRASPETGYIGLSPMRCLARLPYGEAFESTEVFVFEELKGTIERDKCLWMNPCFIGVLLLAQSYRRFGWEMGQHLQQDVEKLPLIFYKEDGETKTVPCAEVVLTESLLEKFLEQGLMPLISFRDSDRIRLPRFQSIAFPMKKLCGGWLV